MVITQQIYISGVLADPDSVTFSDPDNLYGVRRSDTLGIVVAAGTALTKVSTGVYTYTLTETVFDLTYDGFISYVVGEETFYIPFTKEGTQTSPTLTVGTNTYISLVDAQTYINSTLYRTLWNNSTDQEVALIAATRIIDQLQYIGTKALEEQTLQFPRKGQTDIPEVIKQATVEQAVAMLKNPDYDSVISNLNVIQESAGAATTFDRSAIPEHLVYGILSFRAWQLVYPYLLDGRTLTINRK